LHNIGFYYIIQAFLDAIVNLEFQTIESLWREFWRSQDNNNGDECEEEKYLSKYVQIFQHSIVFIKLMCTVELFLDVVYST
jgi:hypothetical protein